MHTFLISAGKINNRRQKQIHWIASLWQITNITPCRNMIHVKKHKNKNKKAKPWFLNCPLVQITKYLPIIQ